MGDAPDDDLLVEVVEVVLVGQEQVAGPGQPRPLGQPDEAPIALGVQRDADDPARHETGTDDGQGEQRLGPRELGVVDGREVAVGLALGQRATAARVRRLLATLATLTPFVGLGRGQPGGAVLAGGCALALDRRVHLRRSLQLDRLRARLDVLLELLPVLAEGHSVGETGDDRERGEDADRDEDQLRGLVRTVVCAGVREIVLMLGVLADTGVGRQALLLLLEDRAPAGRRAGRRERPSPTRARARARCGAHRRQRHAAPRRT